MVIRNVLLATEAGLGNGETPIFPIHIFKVKRGVNFREGEPSADLFKLAAACPPNACSRTFPSSRAVQLLALQARPSRRKSHMGCRTRYGQHERSGSREIVNGRGNLSFTSINLPPRHLQITTSTSSSPSWTRWWIGLRATS
ncbi:MAG: anaerobic ribonucleoside-triphosphate reductase [Bilophila wadsworthia]